MRPVEVKHIRRCDVDLVKRLVHVRRSKNETSHRVIPLNASAIEAAARMFERVADHVLESISGHLSRRMLEHYSHIRIDAKRQALDALDAARRAPAENGDGNGADKGNGEAPKEDDIEALLEVSDELTSQSRHSLTLNGSPPHGKLLIPLNRRDVRVVEGARLESEAGEQHQPTPKRVNAYAISDLTFQSYHSVCVRQTSMFF
jgi:hypothetical protein